jgi:large repetitive protein
VTDGVLTDVGTVTITVTAVNDAPVAGDDADSIAEDGSSTVDVLANDSDVENDPLTVVSVTQGANGTVVDNGDGTVTYTPDPDWNGVDFYTYTVSDGALTDTATVTVTVTAVNDAPVAVDDADTILEDGSSTVDVLANDTDVENDPLTVVSVTQGANGSVVRQW